MLRLLGFSQHKSNNTVEQLETCSGFHRRWAVGVAASYRLLLTTQAHRTKEVWNIIIIIIPDSFF
jgi:hypothetical protein